MEQRDTTGNLLTTFGFHFLRKPSLLYKFCEPGDVFRQKNRVVNQLFVTLIAEHNRLTFVAPRTGRKQALGFCTATIC